MKESVTCPTEYKISESFWIYFSEASHGVSNIKCRWFSKAFKNISVKYEALFNSPTSQHFINNTKETLQSFDVDPKDAMRIRFCL